MCCWQGSRSANGGARWHYHPAGSDARGCRGGGGGGRPPTCLHVGRPPGKSDEPGPLVPPVRWGRAPLCGRFRGAFLGVWDTGTGAFLGTLWCPGPLDVIHSLVTYQRASDDRPRVAAVFGRGRLCIWDGDDMQVLPTFETHRELPAVRCLAVYEEPTSGRTRLVTG
jgi:hypothetical protein